MATIPTQGRIVHYCLSKSDASHISKTRQPGPLGRSVEQGTICPAIVVGAPKSAQTPADLMKVALHCFLDGPDTYYVPEADIQETPEFGEAAEPGMWFWPPGAPTTKASS